MKNLKMDLSKLKSIIISIPKKDCQQIKGGDPNGGAHVNPLHESSSNSGENPLFGQP